VTSGSIVEERQSGSKTRIAKVGNFLRNFFLAASQAIGLIFFPSGTIPNLEIAPQSNDGDLAVQLTPGAEMRGNKHPPLGVDSRGHVLLDVGLAERWHHPGRQPNAPTRPMGRR
jgi:hypothetical protein